MSIFKNHYLILSVSLILPFVYMYNIDWPQSLSTKLQQPPYSYTLQKINLIYTFTSLGVTLLIFKMGTIYDALPLKYTVIVLPSILALCQGSITLMFKYYQDWNYYVVLVVRVIYGIAGQSLFMLQAMVLIRIYRQKSGPYVGYGIGTGILGSPVNSLFTPLLYTATNQVYFPLLIGTAIAIVFIGIAWMISRVLIQHQKNAKLQNLIQVIQQKKSPVGLWQQVKSFNSQFWIFQLLIFIQNSACAGFITIGVDFINKRFNFSYVDSGKLMLIPYTLGLVSSFGWNHIPLKLRNSLVLVSLISVGSFIGIYFLPNISQSSPPPGVVYFVIVIIFLFLVGTAYGGYMMKIVPSIFITTKPQDSGATYGVVAIAIHSVYLILPLLAALIVGKYDTQAQGYKNLCFLYIGLAGFSLCLTLYMRISSKFQHLDKISNQELQKSRSSIL